MKVWAHRVYSNPKYAKVFHWGKLLTITGGAQIIVQAVGLLCGILVIRVLPTNEFALYTIANAMLGTITVLSDGGIGAGVLSIGGRCWNDPERLGVVITTGLDLRKKFAAVSLIISIPVLFYFIRNNGAGWINSIFIILSLVPAFLANLSDTILEIPYKLKQAIFALQKNQVAANVGRLLLTVISILIFPFSSVALVAAGLPRIYANYTLRKGIYAYADLNQLPDPVIKKEIIDIVKKSLPGALYYSISGQITIWLISIFGSTSGIAEIGALSRLTMLLNIFSVMFTTLIVPRFAKLVLNKKIILTRFLQMQLLLLAVTLCIISTVYLFSNQFLLIIGHKYSGLNDEIVLMTAGSCIGMIAGLTHAISLSRGWVLPPVINIAGNVITQVVLIAFLNLSKTRNVIYFSIINVTVALVMLVIYFIYRTYKIEDGDGKSINFNFSKS